MMKKFKQVFKPVIDDSRRKNNLNDKQVFNYYTYNDKDRIFDYDQPTLSEKYSPQYGHLFAKQILKCIKENKIKYIIEVGAGRGQLAYDILSFFKKTFPEVLKKVKYCIIELSQNLAVFQKRRLLDFNVSVIVGTATSLPFKKINDNLLIISNEMIADLPYIYAKTTGEAIKYYSLLGFDNFNYSSIGYLNFGVLLFLKEINRIMNNGCIYLIEYGRKDKSVLNKLGTNKIYHYECGINWKLIKLFSRKFFQIEDEGPLSHLFHIDLPVTKKIIFYLIVLIMLLGVDTF